MSVLLLTAHSDTATVERAQRAKAFGYILKPYGERDLRIQIEMTLYRHYVERQLSENERHRILVETMLQALRGRR